MIKCYHCNRTDIPYWDMVLIRMHPDLPKWPWCTDCLGWTKNCLEV